MPETQTAVIRLSDLQADQEAECFAALVRKVSGTTYKNESFLKCYFRDRRVTVEAPLWSDSRWLKQAQTWADGEAYRLHVKGKVTPKYGLQVEILNIRPATLEDRADGYDYYDLFESSRFPDGHCYSRIAGYIEQFITDPKLAELVRTILDDNAELFQKLPAAQNMHHGYVGGLVEHIWSVTRVAASLATHYAAYYEADLNPPLNKGVVVAAAILHDIGKLKELEFNPIEARYTKEGTLVGHILIGRDMVRDAARRIDGFDEETLLLLEHAILAHHGKAEYGAPKSPCTLEAL
ncbi:MAG TPA: HD domain-containing protein, partial [Isosphaeraceae bacterium]|nr:HD domain-containing protein [Isosphaeraceae bacterium]